MVDKKNLDQIVLNMIEFEHKNKTCFESSRQATATTEHICNFKVQKHRQ